jgi:hypothetical protein
MECGQLPPGTSSLAGDALYRSDIYAYCNILKEYLARCSARSSIAHTYMLMSEMQVAAMMIEVDGIAVKLR